MNQKERLLACADKLQEFCDLIEPLFKAGHKGFAPDTDWWCIIAGDRHNAIADVRMYRAFAEGLDGPRQEYKPEWLDKQMRIQRSKNVAESEIDSPCAEGCMMTWRKQYGTTIE